MQKHAINSIFSFFVFIAEPPEFIEIAPEPSQTAESVLKEIRDNQVGWSNDNSMQYKALKIRRKLYEGSYPNSSVPDENEIRSSVLRYAWKGKIDKLRKYFEEPKKWQKVNRQDDLGRTALHYAASWGDTKLIQFLLSIPGINLNIKDCNDMTPLFKAVEIKSLAAVKLLIDGGANPLITLRDGRNIIEYTIMQYGDRCIDILKYLIGDFGFRYVKQVSDRMTYLHMATLTKRENPIYQTVELLLEYGSDINALEGNGRSPLILAAIADRADIIYPLLREFADVKIYDKFLKDAFRYAKEGSR